MPTTHFISLLLFFPSFMLWHCLFSHIPNNSPYHYYQSTLNGLMSFSLQYIVSNTLRREAKPRRSNFGWNPNNLEISNCSSSDPELVHWNIWEYITPPDFTLTFAKLRKVPQFPHVSGNLTSPWSPFCHRHQLRVPQSCVILATHFSLPLFSQYSQLQHFDLPREHQT